MKKGLFVVLMGIVMFSGCTKDNTTVSNYTPSCTGTAKSYKSDVAPIISSSCGGCHQNYKTYANLFGSRSSVRSAIVSGQMPQGSSLSTAQKDAIVCWIDNGATNN